jgi:hypothetical protein
MNQGDLLYKRAKQNAVISQKRYSTLATQSEVNPENVVYDIEEKSLPSVADFMKQLEAEKAKAVSAPAAAEKTNKVGTQQDVLAVAKKLNISPDAALQRLRAAGWSIQ